jgi:hypothetical protein
LAYVAGVVNAAGQPAKISLLNGFERPYAYFGQFGNLLERNAPVTADFRKSQHAIILVHRTRLGRARHSPVLT